MRDSARSVRKSALGLPQHRSMTSRRRPAGRRERLEPTKGPGAPDHTASDWKTKIRHFLLDLDARIDFDAVLVGQGPARALRALLHLHGPLPCRRLAALGASSSRCRRRATLGLGGLIADAGAGGPGVSRNRRRRLAEEIRSRGDVPRPLRQRDRQPRHQAQRLDPAGRFPGQSDQGDAGDRGPPLLRPFRHRHRRHRARARHQRAGRRRAPGRLVDHPAAGQEPVPDQRAHHRAQGQGGVPRDLAGDAADQERDPEALSRPRLYGRRHLRRRRRGAFLLQQVGARREPGRSRDAGRPVQGADQIRAAHQPAGRARPRQRRARQSGRCRLHDRRPGVRRAPQSRHRRRPPRRALAELLSRLGLRRDEASSSTRSRSPMPSASSWSAPRST